MAMFGAWRAVCLLVLPAAGYSGTGLAAGLTLAWEAEPRTIDPRYAVDANSQYLEDLLHCSLIAFDPSGHLIAGLAQRWDWTSPTTLKLTLKPHVTFADGSPVTAADVVATYQAFKQPGSTAPRQGAFRNLQSITAQGKSTVIAELNTPDASFVANLAVGILPARWASGPMLSEKDSVSGCGPFVLQAATTQTIDLTANTHYSLGLGPKVASVTIKIVKDENTRYAKLIAGELDLIQNLLNRDKLAIIGRDHPGLKIVRRPGLNTSYIGFNMRDPVVGNKWVRQAITHAIDKAKLVKYVLGGMALPADTLLPEMDPFHAVNLPQLAYDPGAAKRLLDQAGYKADASGKRLTLTYKTTTDQTRVLVAKAVAAELRQVGIYVTIETLEWGRFKADVEHGRVQMWSLSWVGFKDPDIYRYAFATSSFPPAGGNRGWYSNKALDQLLQSGMTATEPGKRAGIYAEAEALLVADAPYVFLWHEDVFAVMKTAVDGFEVYADGRLSSLATTFKSQ